MKLFKNKQHKRYMSARQLENQKTLTPRVKIAIRKHFYDWSGGFRFSESEPSEIRKYNRYALSSKRSWFKRLPRGTRAWVLKQAQKNEY